MLHKPADQFCCKHFRSLQQVQQKENEGVETALTFTSALEQKSRGEKKKVEKDVDDIFSLLQRIVGKFLQSCNYINLTC